MEVYIQVFFGVRYPLYRLTETRNFVETCRLEAGDVIEIYKYSNQDKYFIGAKKKEKNPMEGKFTCEGEFSGGTPLSLHNTSPTPSDLSFNLVFFFDKILTSYDMTYDGEGVILKGHINLGTGKEPADFPYFTEKNKSQIITMVDMDHKSRAWTFKYKCYELSCTPTYCLTKTEEFLNTHSLKIGDSVKFYKDKRRNIYAIRAVKKIEDDSDCDYESWIVDKEDMNLSD